MSNMVPLETEGGYRERVFFKAWLAQRTNGKIPWWKQLLATARFDTHTDVIWWKPIMDGAGGAVLRAGGFVSVAWEGSKSREILAKYGLSDADCLHDQEDFRE